MVDIAITAGRLLIRDIEHPETRPDPVVYPAEPVVRDSTTGRPG